MSQVTQKAFDFLEAEENALMNLQFAILDELEARGWSQRQFADLLGVTNARVSQLLSPDANPTLKLTARALALLDLKADYVLAGKEARSSKKSAKRGRSDFSMFEAHAWDTASEWKVRPSTAANENFAEFDSKQRRTTSDGERETG